MTRVWQLVTQNTPLTVVIFGVVLLSVFMLAMAIAAGVRRWRQRRLEAEIDDTAPVAVVEGEAPASPRVAQPAPVPILHEAPVRMAREDDAVIIAAMSDYLQTINAFVRRDGRVTATQVVDKLLLLAQRDGNRRMYCVEEAVRIARQFEVGTAPFLRCPRQILRPSVENNMLLFHAWGREGCEVAEYAFATDATGRPPVAVVDPPR